MQVGPKNEIDLPYIVGPKIVQSISGYSYHILAIEEESDGRTQEEKRNIEVPKNHDSLHLSHEDEYLSISIPSDSAMDKESSTAVAADYATAS